MDDTNSSPTWKKPSDIMKKHRKKKRVSLQSSDEKPPNKLTDIFSTKSMFLQSKRRNPFSQEIETGSPSKRMKCENEELSPNSDNSQENALFTILGGIEKAHKYEENQQVEISTPSPGQTEHFSIYDDDSKSQFEFIEKLFNDRHREQNKEKFVELEDERIEDPMQSTDIPVDWSLKVKMRVISEKSLLWCTQLRTAEEARGISQFLTGPPDTLMALKESERKAHFQEAGLYWIYPSLPWMKLFPRIAPDAKLRTANIGLLDNLVQTALQSDWTESFTSVFHQLRAQHCPYFYVCTHQFSVLFRASAVAGQTNLSALITPTTRGMRQSLKGEDISFTLPVLEHRKNCINPEKGSEVRKKQGTQTKKAEQPYLDDEDEMIDTDEGASVWLESIGLDKKHFPSLEPNKVKIQREGFKLIDNRPESTVHVIGSDVQALYNYLLNCRSCVATSGPQAGLPPTILSPTAFKGATLKSHQTKHSLVKQMDDNKLIKPVHILEICGPVLPHHIASYKWLFQHTQEGHFSLSFNTHEPSISFNAPVGSEDDITKDVAIREQFVMGHRKFDSFFSNKPVDSRLTCIKDIQCKLGFFSFLV
ncbi:protein downstream neighbor of son homolog [Mizuhopecten yessoensis]|uniref:Protein downstream neighbor of son-like n=1 Tax=Mizuhopecten yessoensis TaxID=6573 RepID=A0A210Q1V7_MIZYE|nr:protein downstream neighbor of son homolog [Mizuhopecten yessoensis]OWF42711.1 Protein downstream neighbor of son-like [Mizuhopecten yessoensis]